MVYKKVVFSFIIFLILFTSCNTNEPDSTPANLEFAAEDASCTEAWIKLEADNIKAAQVFREDSLIYSFNTNSIDTVLYDEGLLPNQSYKYKLTIQQSNNSSVSKELTLQTMDTTSHNFTWQTFTFGQHSSSSFYDVAIINENNIWAVGEIYMNDSLGNPDPHAYNAVHWDGSEWELKKIGGYGGWTCRTVFAFSANDVWFEGTIKWDGEKYTVHNNGFPLEPNGDGWVINKLWGSSSNDLYAVGNNGNIAHWDGNSWKKIESGTTSIINDVWGIKDRQSRTVLYCPVSSFFVPGDKKILKLTNGIIDSVKWNRDVRLYSAWAINENFLFVCGEGVFENKFNKWSKINLLEAGTNSIRGNNTNDIFVVGDYGFIAHFNGLSWKVFNSFNYKGYSEVSVKEDIVAVSGNYNGLGIIEIGKRK